MKTIIFVGGSSHSGSTMLDLMLSNNISNFSAGEVVSLFRPSKPHHKNPICGCGSRNCKVWRNILRLGEAELYNNLFNENPKINTILDSSKRLSWIYDQTKYLKKYNFKVYHVLIWKEPVDISISLYKRNRINTFNKIWVSYYKNYLKIIPHPITVKYESLVKEPSKTIKNVCSKLGINHSLEQHRYWTKRHHTLFGSASSRIHLHDQETSEYKRLLLHIKNKQQKNISTSTLTHTKNYRQINYNKPDPNILPSKELSEIKNCRLAETIKKELISLDHSIFDLNMIKKEPPSILIPPLTIIKDKILNSIRLYR